MRSVKMKTSFGIKIPSYRDVYNIIVETWVYILRVEKVQRISDGSSKL